MGMQWMREELEDLGFRVLNPEARNSIIRRFLTLQKESGDVVHQITADIRTVLERDKIEADVYGRAKKPYSIWRKMQEKDLAFSRLSDIYGFRIICLNVGDCYRILGAIHQRWRAVPGRFKRLRQYQPAQIQRVSFAPHLGVRTRWQARRSADPHPRNARGGRGRCGKAHWSYREGGYAR